MSASELQTDGAAHHPGAALSILPDLIALTDSLAPDRAGIRLHDNPAVRALVDCRPVRAIAIRHLGENARAVRAILFDKSPATNWALGWHQDRTIVVHARHDVPGYGPWSRKAGLQHVGPPFALIDAMLTMRIHLDDVPVSNAPLLIAPGSHRLGRIAENGIAAVVSRCGVRACLAEAGDIWAYATPILHASAATAVVARRRVLQVDFSGEELPEPLRWRGL